jgi:hypothetical protein
MLFIGLALWLYWLCWEITCSRREMQRARREAKAEILYELSTVPLDERAKTYARLCEEAGVEFWVQKKIREAWDDWDIHQPE